MSAAGTRARHAAGSALLALLLSASCGSGTFGIDGGAQDSRADVATGTGGTSGLGGGSGFGGSGAGGGGFGGSGAGGSGQGDGTTAPDPIVGTPVATFESDLQGFVLSTYHDTDGQVNLGDALSGLPQPPPLLSVDPIVGSPSPGSLRVTAPFSGADQYLEIENTTIPGTAHPGNWVGGTLHVRIKADVGVFRGAAQPFVLTTASYVFAGTSFNPVSSDGWQEFALALDDPMTFGPGYDAHQVVGFGIMLNSGAAGVNQGPVTFHIDSFSIELADSPPDAGADGAGD